MAALALLARGGGPPSPGDPGLPLIARPVLAPGTRQICAPTLRRSPCGRSISGMSGGRTPDPSSLEVASASAAPRRRRHGAAGRPAHLPSRRPEPLFFPRRPLRRVPFDSAPLFKSIDPSKPALIDGQLRRGEPPSGGSAPARATSWTGSRATWELLQQGWRISRAPRPTSSTRSSRLPRRSWTRSTRSRPFSARRRTGWARRSLSPPTRFSEIHYDQMTITAERVADMDLRLTEIDLISPRFGSPAPAGSPTRRAWLSRTSLFPSTLSSVPGVSSARSWTSWACSRRTGFARLCQAGPPIHLGGTLRAVDQSQWKDLLVAGVAQKGGRFV